MSFQTFFIGVILLAIIAPTQFAELGTRLASALYPVIEKGLVVALMFAGIMIIVGRFK